METQNFKEDKCDGTTPVDKCSSAQEGVRMKLFRDVIERVVKLCVSSARFKKFALNLKPIYKRDAENFRKLHQKFIEQFKQHIFAEMECMYKEENIAQILNEIDRLSEDSEPNITAWRPSGEPEIDIEAHLLSVKTKQCNQLQELVKSLESQNRLLQNALKPKQKKILETSDKIEEQYNKYKELSDVLSESRLKPLEELSMNISS